MAVEVLFIFESSSKLVHFESKLVKKELLMATFRKEMLFLGEVEVQVYDTKLSSFVNIDSSDHVLFEDATKMKFLRKNEKQSGVGMTDKNTAFFMCDLQERFRKSIGDFAQVIEVSSRLLKASEILKDSVPLIVTEQYPKGLLHTVEELGIDHAKMKVEKTKFSMLVPEVEEFLFDESHIKNIVLFGVEAHVCVQQTALDLIELGLNVFIVADATSSRYSHDRHFAFRRLQASGAILTTHESVLFQLIRDKNHPQFKAIQKLIIEQPSAQPSLMSMI